MKSDRANKSGEQPQKRCWNCRDRKVACDRAVPACRNCVKRGQQCLGYGLKLSWPKGDDGRRSAKGTEDVMLLVDASQLQFVNATSWDVELSNEYGDTGSHIEHTDAWAMAAPIPRGLRPASAELDELDPFLSSKGYSPVARAIAAISDERTDLYRLLIRMSLGDNTAPAVATRHALTSLSYQHLNMLFEARYHQTRALAALQSSIETLGPTAKMQAFQSMAASMLLNIYETMTTEGSVLSWSIFFCGCKRIANMVHQPNKTYDGDWALILDWVFYHDAMYKFSICHFVQRIPDQVALARDAKIVSKAVFSPQRHVILPSLGCSLEMLDILCQAVDSIRDRNDPSYQSPEHQAQLRILELRLQRLMQHLPAITDADEQHSAPSSATASSSPPAISLMAKIYRLATLIYLQRVGRNLPRSSGKVEPLLDDAFAALKELGGCQRPWPLFIVALEARSDAERKAALQAVTASLKERPLGNMGAAAKMIQAAWVQQDLGGEQLDPLFVYNAVISANKLPPSFT